MQAAGSPHLGLQAAVQLLQPLVSALHSPALGQLPMQAVDRHLHFQQPRLLPLPKGGAEGRQEGWAALTGRSCKHSSAGCLVLPACAAAPQTRSQQATAPPSSQPRLYRFCASRLVACRWLSRAGLPPFLPAALPSLQALLTMPTMPSSGSTARAAAIMPGCPCSATSPPCGKDQPPAAAATDGANASGAIPLAPLTMLPPVTKLPLARPVCRPPEKAAAAGTAVEAMGWAHEADRPGPLQPEFVLLLSAARRAPRSNWIAGEGKA